LTLVELCIAHDLDKAPADDRMLTRKAPSLLPLKVLIRRSKKKICVNLQEQ
jgi:hypothetical protein